MKPKIIQCKKNFSSGILSKSILIKKKYNLSARPQNFFFGAKGVNGKELVSTYESCLNIAKGEKSIGLVDVNSQFYSILKNILNMFENSGKTKEELAQIFLTGLVASTDVANVSIGFFKILYESTYKKFKEEVDFVKKETIYLAVFILMGSSLGTLVTWKWVVKKIFRIQRVDWHILQVIPVNLILNNKHLQQYLLKHSDGELDGIKRFL